MVLLTQDHSDLDKSNIFANFDRGFDDHEIDEALWWSGNLEQL